MARERGQAGRHKDRVCISGTGTNGPWKMAGSPHNWRMPHPEAGGTARTWGGAARGTWMQAKERELPRTLIRSELPIPA